MEILNTTALTDKFQIGICTQKSKQELAENNKGNRKVQQEVEELLEKIDRMKTLFASPNFWYCNVSYIATAKK